MDVLKIELEFPSDLFIALNVPKEQIETKVKEWMVLQLFRDSQISSGKAAQILGITKGAFIDMLHHSNIPYLDWSANELAQEVTAAMNATQDYTV